MSCDYGRTRKSGERKAITFTQRTLPKLPDNLLYYPTYQEVPMQEKKVNWHKPMRKLLALIVLTAGTLFVLEPTQLVAQSQSCGSRLNLCTLNCPYINPQHTLRDAGCQSQCVQLNQGCLSSGAQMEEGACDSIRSTCGGINASGGSGPMVGDCFGTYANCEYAQSQNHWGMMQETPSEVTGYDASCEQNVVSYRDYCLQGNDSECILTSTGEVSSDCCYDIATALHEGCRIQ